VEEKGNWNTSHLINSDHILPLQLPQEKGKEKTRVEEKKGRNRAEGNGMVRERQEKTKGLVEWLTL
jgi:hypothetical protein